MLHVYFLQLSNADIYVGSTCRKSLPSTALHETWTLFGSG